MKTFITILPTFTALGLGAVVFTAPQQTDAQSYPVEMHAYSGVTRLSKPGDAYESMKQCKDAAEKHFKNASVVSCDNVRTGENETGVVLLTNGTRAFFWAEKVNPTPK